MKKRKFTIVKGKVFEVKKSGRLELPNITPLDWYEFRAQVERDIGDFNVRLNWDIDEIQARDTVRKWLCSSKPYVAPKTIDELRDEAPKHIKDRHEVLKCKS